MTILATAIAVTISGGADAKSKKTYRQGGPNYYQDFVNRETMDDIRANSLDPAGNYKGYPSWARAALSPDQPR